MIARWVLWCARHPWPVVLCALLLAALGEVGRRHLAGDIVPDLSDPRIGIVADWMGHPADQTAREVTAVLTGALRDVSGVEAVRGTSMSGMAYVDVVLADAGKIEEARKAIALRIERVRPALPSGVRLQVGPPASSTGWIFEYALVDPARVASSYELRRLQDEVLRPALSSLPGVAEVASVGGGLRQLRIEAMPRELRARGLAFTDLADAARAALGDGSASPEHIAAQPIAEGSVRVRDLARVRLTDDMPTGLADLDIYRARFLLIAAMDAHLCGALLPSDAPHP